MARGRERGKTSNVHRSMGVTAATPPSRVKKNGMIGSLTGTVTEAGSDALLLDLGGVGYRVAVLSSLRAEARVGATVTLRTYLHVRESELALYGFLTKEELIFFRLLLNVPGVGPKSAMNILEIAPVDILVRAIAGGDATLLTKVSGIGRKTAERIVVELKTRLEREHPELARQGVTPHADVVEALVSLGYTRSQARDAARELPADVRTLEEGVKIVLQALGQRAGINKSSSS